MTDSTTFALLLPEIVLVAEATLIYVAGAFGLPQKAATWLAIAALAIAALVLCSQSSAVLDPSTAATLHSSGPLVVDLFGYVSRWGILAVGLVLMLLLTCPHRFEQSAEEAASLLLMLAGLMLIAAGNELILLFVGLELVSIPTYVLLYVGRHDEKGQEAASKYFFLSILSSAVLLYGFSFMYGMGGSTRLVQIAQVLSGAAAGAAQENFSPVLAPLAMLLVFAGLAFRLTAVPFHFYAPDVYQGTSHANAGVLATLPKIAGLTVLARIVIASMPTADLAGLGWKIALVIAVLTMTLGNMMALWQNNIRRLLAYSSIAHAGYILIGVAVALATQTNTGILATDAAAKAFDGLGASMFYLAVYMFATMGAFAALVYLSSSGERQVDTLDDIAGVNRRHPVVALVMAVFMFSLAGLPPLAGFWGKFALLFSALTLDEAPTASGVLLRPWFIGLAIVTVLNAAIGAAYYLRVIGVMYFRAPEESALRAQRGAGAALAMWACLAVVVGVGLYPGKVVTLTNAAGRSLEHSAMQQATGEIEPSKPAHIAMRGDKFAP